MKIMNNRLDDPKWMCGYREQMKNHMKLDTSTKSLTWFPSERFVEIKKIGAQVEIDHCQ